MKELYKRIIAGSFTLVILFFSCVSPAYALGVDVGFDIDADFWSWVVSVGYNDVNYLKSFIFEDVCRESPKPDGLHNFKEQRTTVDGKTGLFYICEYCGKSAGEVGKEAYDNQVSELPANNINSQGLSTFYVRGWTYTPYPNNGKTVPTTVISDSSSDYIFCECYTSSTENGVSAKAASGNFTVPVQGTYRFVFPAPEISKPINRYQVDLISTSSDGESVRTLLGYANGFSKNVVLSPLFTYQVVFIISMYNIKPHEVAYYSSRPYFSGVQVYDSDDTRVSATTRPTSITGGNYGIVGDNGEITTITNNNQIINETNNTYYNPATGTTAPITEWSYDYSDRSYKVAVEGGDTYTVTYGDENIVIKEGDVTYNIYYMIDGSGSDNPSPAPSICPHSWQESSRTEPACTSPGKVVYTCSQCGQTKSETLKALGHDWQVERTVKTLYDENGNVTQQGYTIYQCSICGEQYKDADSTGPPDDTVNDGGLIEWLNGLIKHLSDNLSGAVDLILSFFQEIPKLFGGFLDFLSAMFPYLPDDIIFLLTFGIAALVFVGVIKAIRR